MYKRQSLESNDGVYLVPAFVGLGAPYWDSSATAMITGMTRGTKKAHIVRATLESMAYQVKDILDIMTAEAGVTLKEIRVDGGPTRNKFLMQFQADILNTMVAVSYTHLDAVKLSLCGADDRERFWQDFKCSFHGGF